MRLCVHVGCVAFCVSVTRSRYALNLPIFFSKMLVEVFIILFIFTSLNLPAFCTLLYGNAKYSGTALILATGHWHRGVTSITRCGYKY